MTEVPPIKPIFTMSMQYRTDEKSPLIDCGEQEVKNQEE